MTAAEPLSAAPRWRVFFVAWTLLSALCAAWAISTPIAAVPDEPAHLVKAASVVRGELVGRTGPGGQIVSVPRWVADTHSQTCFAFLSDATADCALTPLGDASKLVEAPTSAGLYNPVYYAIVGTPSLVFTDSSGVYAMRILSGMVASVFLALALALVAAFRRRRIPIVATLIAITPMVLFLNSGVNPNGLEISATLAAFVGVLSLIALPDRRSVTVRAVIVAISAAIAVNMRGLSPLWVGLALCAPLLLASWPALKNLLARPAIRWMIVAIGVAGALAAAWILGSGSLVAGVGAAVTPVRAEVPFTGASPLVGFIEVIQGTFDLGLNMVGLFGWLDTPAPPGVYFVWSAFIASLAVASFVVLRGRRLLVAALLVAGVVIVPALVQAAYITGGGYIWQGRYTLPLFVCAIVGMGFLVGEALPDTRSSRPRRLVIAFLALWGVSQFFAFAMALRRYSVGVLDSWQAMVRSPEWNPPGGVIASLLVFLALVTLASIAAYRLIERPVSDAERPTDVPAPAGPSLVDSRR